MRKMKRLSLGKVKVVTFSNSKQIYGGEQGGETYLCSSFTTLQKTTTQNQSHNSTDDLSADTDCIV